MKQKKKFRIQMSKEIIVWIGNILNKKIKFKLDSKVLVRDDILKTQRINT
jgi:hypothetical protein